MTENWIGDKRYIFVNNNTVLLQMFIFQQDAIQQIVYT